MKKISIIVPVYNIEKYLERCIQSIVEQTYFNLEIILVDDGARDFSGEIADQLALRDQRIRVIHKENEGVSKARMTGVEHATGDYIGFVDGDDVIEADMYEFLMKNIVETGSEISHCGYRMVFPDRQIDYYGTNNKKIQEKEDGLRDLLEGRFEPSLVNKLYDKRLFQNVSLDFNIKINEDLLLNYYLFKNAKLSVYQDCIKYYYMVRNNSATSTFNIHKYEDPIKVMREMIRQENGRLLPILNYRYTYLLSKVCVLRVKEGSEEFQHLKNTSKMELKKQINHPGYEMSFKEKMILNMALYFPQMYRCIHEIYSRAKGSKDIYKV